jgi:hypothetical protein
MRSSLQVSRDPGQSTSVSSEVIRQVCRNQKGAVIPYEPPPEDRCQGLASELTVLNAPTTAVDASAVSPASASLFCWKVPAIFDPAKRPYRFAGGAASGYQNTCRSFCIYDAPLLPFENDTNPRRHQRQRRGLRTEAKQRSSTLRSS